MIRPIQAAAVGIIAIGSGLIGGASVSAINEAKIEQVAYLPNPVKVLGPFSMSYGALSVLNLANMQQTTLTVSGVTTSNLLMPLPCSTGTTIVPDSAVVTTANTVVISYHVASTIAISAGTTPICLAQVK